MTRRNGIFVFVLAMLLAVGCTSEHSTTGEGQEQAMEGTNEMAEPAMEETAMEMEEPAAQQPAAAPAPSRPSPPPQPAATPPPTPSPRETAPPPAPAQPAMATVRLPEGTTLLLELRTDLSTKTNMVGDEFKARVLEPVTMGGMVMIPERSTVWGTVTETVSAQKMKGQAQMSLSFDRLELPDGTFHTMSAVLTEEGVKVGKRTGGIIGGSAAGGALLGKIIGKDTKSAVKGALIGAVVGTGIAAAQKGQELELPKGTEMSIVLETPLDLPEPR